MTKNEFMLFCQATIGREEIDEVTDSLKNGWLTMGKKVIQFEQEFAKYVGVKYAVSVNSCTAALHLALLAHGIGPGDEVIVPSYTFVATANVVIHVGATPVLVDIDRQSLNIDAAAIERKISKKTKAIIAVHFGGLPADLTAINRLAKKHKLIVIEDAAHAVGSMYKGKQIGTHGNTTCFSFYATKNLTTGEGGMLTTNSKRIAEFVSRNRIHGISKDAWKRYSKEGSWKYDVLFPGYKCNMTDIQASLGLHQLKKLEEFTARRTEIARAFDMGFADNPAIETVELPTNVRHAYHLYPILLHGVNRDEFIKQMGKNDIGVSVHFIPIHTFSYYKKRFTIPKSEMKNTNDVFKRIVSLPLYPKMTKKDVERVIETVNRLTKK
jgi:dTDP-4-amino-4,6-dideoxygalactose transaminase